MLRVVQTAVWDWAPPHMSGYPHLPPPPPQYPPPHAHGQPRQSYHEDPQWPTYPPLPRAPLRLHRMVRRRGAPRLPCPMARPLAQRASRLAFNRRRSSAHSPMRHRSRRCVGGCGTNPIVRPPLRFSMRGLYGAVSHMYVDPRSCVPNVPQLGGPPCFSTGSVGDRRDAGNDLT